MDKHQIRFRGSYLWLIITGSEQVAGRVWLMFRLFPFSELPYFGWEEFTRSLQFIGFCMQISFCFLLFECKCHPAKWYSISFVVMDIGIKLLFHWKDDEIGNVCRNRSVWSLGRRCTEWKRLRNATYTRNPFQNI